MRHMKRWAMRAMVGLAVLGALLLQGTAEAMRVQVPFRVGGSTVKCDRSILIAAVNSPPDIKRCADYVCDGVDDQVQIQAAIDSLPAYDGNYNSVANGGEVILAPGTYWIGNSIQLRGSLKLSGSSVYSPRIYMANGTNKDIFIYNRYTAASTNDGANQFSDWGNITGIWGTNTSGGILYASVVDNGDGTFKVCLYKDSSQTSLVGHSNNYSAPGTLTITPDSASGLGGTITALTTGVVDTDIYVTYTKITQGFLSIRDLFIDGLYWMPVSASGAGKIDWCLSMTGMAVGTNTSSNGSIFASMIDDGSGYFHVALYKDSARTSLVGHTATYNSTGMKAVVADNASGLGGTIGVSATGIGTCTFQGNWAGCAIKAGPGCWDTYISNIMIFHAPEDGIQCEEGWGWSVDNTVIEFCGGDGIKFASTWNSNSGRSKISNCKIIDNYNNGVSFKSYVYDSAKANDDSKQLGDLRNITGIAASNTNNGILYVTVYNNGDSTYKLQLYSNSGRTTLVGHSNNYSAPGTLTITADGSSGLSGTLTALTSPVADADITITYIIAKPGGGYMICNNEVQGAYTNVTNRATGVAGFYVDSVTTAKFVANTLTTINTSNYGIYIAATSNTSGCVFSDNAFSINTGATGTYGIYSLSNGSYGNVFNGNTFNQLANGIKLDHYTNEISGNLFMTNTAGVTVTTYCVVANNTFVSCTTGLVVSSNTNSISGNHFNACNTGISFTASGQSNSVIGNSFRMSSGFTGITFSSGAYYNIVSGNDFVGSGTANITDNNSALFGTGANRFLGNFGYTRGELYNETTTAVSGATTLTAADSGKILAVSATAVITLPTAAVGLTYTFLCNGADGAVQISISPASTDAITGMGTTGVTNKDLINTLATAKRGDMIRIVGTASNTWYIQIIRGTWAWES